MKKFQPTVVSAVSTLVMFAVLIGLGTWQVQRLAWKNALVAQIESQMSHPAVPMPETIPDPKSWEYRRVTLAGQFLYDHEFLIKPRTLDGVNGYHMLVPFQRASGGIVMVNRGWISDALLSEAERPRGLIQIEGIMQLPRPAYFTPPNDPGKKDWYWADTAAMAAAANLKNAAPVVVTIAGRTQGVYPVGGKVEVNLRNDHKAYAIFWYFMAFVLLTVFFIRSRQPLAA